MDRTFLAESHSQKSQAAHDNSGATSGKGTLLLVTLVLMLTLCGSKFQGQEPARQQRTAHIAGDGTHVDLDASVLGAFLKRVANASVRKKEVGVLTGSNTDRAKFTAIVAWDPANPAVKVKGLEVRLVEGDLKVTVYIDDDKEEPPHGSLVEFQDLLTQLVRRKEEVIKRCHEGDEKACNEPGITSPGFVTTGALNRSAPSQSEYYPRFTILNAGWYGGAKGVLIVSGNPAIDVRLPGVDLDDVVKAIAAGRAFLDAN